MKKNFLTLIILTLIFTSASFADENIKPAEPNKPIQYGNFKTPPKPNSKEIKQIDKMLEKRLNLTNEQVKLLKANKQKNAKELEDIIEKMEKNHKKIREIYMLGIPAYQADLKSAPYKMELVILKQNADKIRFQNRKYFESVLTPEQRVEFKKIKSELPKRRPHMD